MPGNQQKLGMSINEVAHRLGVHRNTVQIWIKEKKLRAIRIGRKWIVTEADLQTFLDKRANMERPAA